MFSLDVILSAIPLERGVEPPTPKLALESYYGFSALWQIGEESYKVANQFAENITPDVKHYFVKLCGREQFKSLDKLKAHLLVNCLSKLI